MKCLSSGVTLVHVCAGEGTRKPEDLSPIFLSFSPFPHLGLPSLTFLSTFFSTYSNGRNYEVLHGLVQTLCLHLIHSTLLRETLIAGHYLRFDYFQ